MTFFSLDLILIFFLILQADSSFWIFSVSLSLYCLSCFVSHSLLDIEATGTADQRKAVLALDLESRITKNEK